VYCHTFGLAQFLRFFLSLDIEIEKGESSTSFREAERNVSANSTTSARNHDQLALELPHEIIGVNRFVDIGIQTWLNHGREESKGRFVEAKRGPDHRAFLYFCGCGGAQLPTEYAGLRNKATEGQQEDSGA
jgi:hypothetical protein